MANLVAYLNARPISTRFHIRVATVRVVQVMRETTGIDLPAGARPTSTAKLARAISIGGTKNSLWWRARLKKKPRRMGLSSVKEVPVIGRGQGC